MATKGDAIEQLESERLIQLVYVSLYSMPAESDNVVTSDYDYHNGEAGRLTEFLLEYCDLRQAGQYRIQK